MKQRILLVDDTPVTVAMCKKKITEAGYIVHTATNGIEGLKEVENYDFNLIITDVIMPLMDGVDFYKQLKKSSRTNKIPILIITDNQVFKESFSFLGVEGFVAKPLDSANLLSNIQKVLSAPSLECSKKILITGCNQNIINETFALLEKNSHKVWKAKNSSDFVSHCLLISPDFIFIDILMKDVPPAETIKALKCFKRFKNLKVLLYSSLETSTSQNNSSQTTNDYQETLNNCIEAGATKYIGPISKANLIAILNDLIET